MPRETSTLTPALGSSAPAALPNANPATLDHSKNGDIEVLRALAILFTMLCHVNRLAPVLKGHDFLMTRFGFWGGVDLFFCISGFVIAASILQQPRTATFAELGIPFWIRRIFRIWPAAAFWLLIPLLCAKLFNLTGGFGQLRSDLPASGAAFAQMANFYFIACKHEQAWGWPCGKADVYWSLSLEEQFYLVFPFLIYFLRRSTLRVVLLALIAAQIFLIRPVDGALWFTRTDAISFGVLIALARRDGWLDAPGKVVQQHPRLAGFAALLLAVAVASISVMPSLQINAGLLALTSAGLVFIASVNADVIVPVAYLRQGLLWIGSRSFSLYLAHIPVMLATREIFYRASHKDPSLVPPAAAVILVALVLLGLCAEGTYRVIETPFRLFGRQVAKNWKVNAIRAPAFSRLWSSFIG